MFTGIIEETGEIKSIKRGAQSAELTVRGEVIFDDLKVGDSVSTNGVCLTVTRINDKTYSADVMNETLSRSSLGMLQVGSLVNLERAMSAMGRFGGHMVSGHIDGTGKIVSMIKDDIAVWFKISASREVMHYIVEKGSIAIDGISLTVAKVERDHFSVSVIPHTVKVTALSRKKIGDKVNLENDIVGKYIEKFMNVPKGITKESIL